MKKSVQKTTIGLILIALAIVVICGSIGAMLDATQSGIIAGFILDIITTLLLLGAYFIDTAKDDD